MTTFAKAVIGRNMLTGGELSVVMHDEGKLPHPFVVHLEMSTGERMDGNHCATFEDAQERFFQRVKAFQL